MSTRILKIIALLFVLTFFSNNLKADCINVLPTFTSSWATICGTGPHSITFTNTSSGVNANTAGYQWYNNGTQFASTTGTSNSVSTALTTAGSYQIMQVAFDTLGVCRDTSFLTVIVFPTPNASFSFPTGNLCPNFDIPFANNSTNTVASTRYLWDFGDGVTDTSLNPTHLYGAGGTYTVSLSVFNSDSCSNTFTSSINILNTPTITIAGDDGDGDTRRCLSVGDTSSFDFVTFVNNSAPGITYTWDFGDGTTTVTQNYATAPDTLTHTFNSFGTFDVVCSAIDANGCTYTDTIIVIFEKYISASFTIPLSQVSGCAPHSVTPINASVNATTYTWDFGDGSAPIDTNSTTAPTHIYDSTGGFTISLTATNSCYSSNSSVGPIMVSNSPIVDFTSSLVGRGCSPQIISFTNNSQLVTPANNFSWDMGNGNTYVGTDPPFQTYSAGTYTIKLVAANDCGKDSMLQVITIDSLPYAQVTVTPLEGCSGMEVGGSATNFGYGTLSRWYVDGVQVAFGDTLPTQTFTNYTAAIQTYIVRYSLTNHCGVYDSTFTVKVHPEVNAILAPTSYLICSGDSIFHQSNSTGDSLSYAWSFGDGTTSTLQGPHKKIYPSQGIDSVMLTVTGYCGVDSVKSLIIIDSIPYAIASVSDIEGCSPMTVSGGAIPYGNNTSSLWRRNGGYYFAGDTFPPVTFTNTGYNLINNIMSYNLSNQCGSYDTAFTIKVHPAVLARMTPINATVCLGDSLQFRNVSNGDSLKVLWKFSNGDTSTFSGPHIRHFNSYGKDTTWLFVDGYCGRDSTFSVTTVSKAPVANIIADVDSGCEDLRVNLTNGAPNGGSYLWNINGGFPFLSSSYTPSVLFTTPGSNAVYLTVDSGGCRSYDTANIVVFPGPDPSFTYTPLSGCSDLEVAITNTSSVSAGDTYAWSFENGNSDVSYSPNNQIFVNPSNTNDSVFSLKLIIYTANGCNDSLTQNVTVHPLPNSSFKPSDTVACEKEVISFQNNSVGSNSYKWYFGDGDSSLINSPNHSYDTAGTYLVMLITNTLYNCQDTSFQSIVINPNPIARFYSDSVCYTYTTSFSDSSLFGPISWKWKFGDGDSSSVQNPIHLYLNDSTYSVSLLVSNTYGCVDSTINSVIVYDRPVANFGNSISCAKKTTNFYDSSSANPIKWNWDFGDGSTDSVKNPTHIYSLGGNYSVRLIVENISGCIDTITQLITISTVPKTYFKAEEVCVGTPTVFQDSTVLGYPASSYFWNFGDGNFSSLKNPVYQYINSGTYFVSLTVTNINGCDSTFSDSVVVNIKPSANFTSDTVCYGLATNFIRSVSPSNPVYYIWNYGDGSGLDTNISPSFYYTYATDGAYLVTLKVINANGCEDSISKSIIVQAKPIAQFSPQVDTLCLGDSVTLLNSSTLATSYFWNFGDGVNDSSVNPTHSYLNDGLFQIKLIVENPYGCIDSTTDTVIVLPTPIADFILDTVCFTNPTTFTNLSSGTNLNSSWSFGDGNSSTNQNPTHTYGLDSSFKTTLTVTTPFGCSDTLSKVALVLPIVQAHFNYSLACVGRTINFNDSSSGVTNSWDWNFGDGNTSNNQNPTHIYSATGNYTVTLIVQSISGCSDTISKTITVNSIPVPNFIADTVCMGNNMNFTNLTTNNQPITSYSWDFGDGNSSFTNNPSYTYAAPGVYTVTLTVTNNGGCDSSISKTVLVNTVPVADFTHDTVCVGLATTFTDASSGIPVSWKWNFGDFSPIDSSGSVVTHAYAASGLYTATLNVQSGVNRCGAQSIKYITVLGGSDASFSVSTPICEGTGVQFVNNSSATGATISSSSWNFGDGNSSTAVNPIHTYPTSGVYKVTLSVVSSQGCIDSDSTNVIVNAIPVVNFGFTKNICLGFPTNFYDSSSITVGSISKWNWSFGDGNTDTIQNPFNNYATSGIYLVNLQVISDSGCSNMTSKNLTINPKALVDFTYTTECVGDSISFKDNSSINTPDSIISWLWEFGDGTFSSLKNPKHNYTGNIQNYTVKLTVTSKFGCINDTSIIISHLPVPVFNYGPPLFAYCEGELVSFTDNSVITPPSSIVSWEWDFGCGHNSFIQNPMHVFDTAGSFKVKLKTTTSDGCVFIDSLPVPLVIYPKPVAKFNPIPSVVSIFRPEVYFDNKSTGAVNYLWSFGDGTTSTDNYPTHMFPNVAGYYKTTLLAYSSFGCFDSISETIYVKNEFTLYAPNAFTPDKDFNQTFLIKGYEMNNFHLKIFNRWGELLFETNDETEGWDGTHKGIKCPLGVYVYVVNVTDNEGINHSKKGHISLIR